MGMKDNLTSIQIEDELLAREPRLKDNSLQSYEELFSDINGINDIIVKADSWKAKVASLLKAEDVPSRFASVVETIMADAYGESWRNI